MRILAVNPGSTSTKIALYGDDGEIMGRNIPHAIGEIGRFRTVLDQRDFRCAAVRGALRSAAGFTLRELSAVAGRGGLLRPMEGGVYEVNDSMKADLMAARYGSHASNLGALIADDIAREAGVRAFIVDPVVVDELSPLARYSGIPEIPRRSIFHALNQKATARRAAAALGRGIEECRLIVAHMGGGTSVGLHEGGRVVDVNNGLDGDGPMSIERAGTVPAGDWMRFALSHQHDPRGLQARLTGRGGLMAFLGINDFREVEAAMAGARPGFDPDKCREVVAALCYQTAKSITALAAAVEGRVDAVVLTGGLAFSPVVVEDVSRRVAFLAPVMVYPGENELAALADGVREALLGRAPIKRYP